MELEDKCSQDDQIYCQKCNWMGFWSDLVCTDTDPDNFKYCPDCESKDIDTI